MKIAFDVDVLAKQMDINRMVHQVADWGYKYIEQSPHPRINPFYKHPLFSKECEQEYRQALRETGVEISSFIVVYRWSGPTEEQRQFAVANWKRMIQIAGDMGVKVINTELSGDPNQQEICNGMWFKSMEELLPLIEREGIRVEIQSHPYDFCELNNETCDMVKSFRSPNLGYVYSSPHGFFYDEGKGDVRSMLKYAGDELTHVLFADTFNQTMDCRYILNPPWLNGRGKADVTVHQKGVEFGSGFAAARMRGSEHNDPIVDASGLTATNHAGGIVGGLTNGNPLVVRAAVKPTASIAREQKTYNLATDRMAG